jgi:putative phage-type endonuclease
VKRLTIGSSDAAAVLGLHRYRSPWAVWARLTGLVEDGSADSNAATRGRRLEPALLSWYAADRGVSVTPGPTLDESPLVHPDYPWATARPDGLTDDALVEAKTAGKLDAARGWGPAGSDVVPIDYRVQTLWQLAVVPRERVDLCAFGTWQDDWRVYSIPYDDRRIPLLLRAIADWHEKYILAGSPPPVDGSEDCTSALRALYPDSPAKALVDATAEDLALARDLLRVRAEIAALEMAKAELDNRLRLRIGDAYGLRGIATWAPTKGRETIDSARLRAEMPDVAATYTKTGEPGRTLRFNYKEEE